MVLSVLTGLSKPGIVRAMEGLEQRGLIELHEQEKKSDLYKICGVE